MFVLAVLLASLSLCSTVVVDHWPSSPNMRAEGPPSLAGVWRTRLNDEGLFLEVWLREDSTFVAEVVSLRDPSSGPRTASTSWIGSWRSGHHVLVLALTEWWAPRDRASGARKILVMSSARLSDGNFTISPREQSEGRFWWLAREFTFTRAH